jgi:crotonobetainyl-CoA:carnitine CoA-transferase CaiB-like acyl-CoA transferase
VNGEQKIRPLAGVKVLDFSTLLPGPLATLILAEAGADVLKIERPGRGDEMRSYVPKFGADSVNFALLNRGKRSLAVDLKDAKVREQLLPLIKEADIVVEQFRPGVMDRLGLGYDDLTKINPRIIYCAITGYGQSGPRAQIAAHDLNYQAEAGMLSLAADATGAPGVPPVLIADIGGGAYPAVINILLALRQRDATGKGCKLDVAMGDNLFTFMYWAMGNGLAAGEWPRPGAERVTGGSPRFNVYRTRDDKFIAAAPLEQKFWENFCEAIQLAPEFHDDEKDAKATQRAVQQLIGAKTAAEWQAIFAGKDLCCCVAATLQEALNDPHFKSRGLFERTLTVNGKSLSALPVPVDEAFRGDAKDAGYPPLGDANGILKN